MLESTESACAYHAAPVSSSKHNEDLIERLRQLIHEIHRRSLWQVLGLLELGILQQ